jgi:hypothetical protein
VVLVEDLTCIESWIYGDREAILEAGSWAFASGGWKSKPNSSGFSPMTAAEKMFST